MKENYFTTLYNFRFIMLFWLSVSILVGSCRPNPSSNEDLNQNELIGNEDDGLPMSEDMMDVQPETYQNTDKNGSIVTITSFKFTDQLIYKYKTNITGYGNYHEGEGNQEGEIVIYVEPKTNTFLFTKEAYGVSGEMMDFVLADTLGNYIIGYSDEFGSNFKETQFIEYVKLDAERGKFLESDFKQYLKPRNERKVFGKKSFPTPTYEAQAYDMTYMKSIDKAKVFLASAFLNMRPVYSFNGLDSETKLTYYFDYNNVIPNRFMPVYEKYNASDGKGYSELILDSYQPTEYYVDLKKYKRLK